jgi:hypothetical protein
MRCRGRDNSGVLALTRAGRYMVVRPAHITLQEVRMPSTGFDSAHVRHWLKVHSVIATLLLAPAAAAEDNLLDNGGFEKGAVGWHDLWTRTPGGNFTIDATTAHTGQRAARIEHTGSQDWSFHSTLSLPVQPGQIFELDGWIRGTGQGTATLCVTLRDERGQPLDWTLGGRTLPAAGDWRRMQSRFVIPRRGRSIEPRLIGNGPAVVWLDDARLTPAGTLDALRPDSLPETLHLANEHLQLDLDLATATMTVTDRRSGRRWEQVTAIEPSLPIVVHARSEPTRIDLDMLDPVSLRKFKVHVQLENEAPEILVTLDGAGELRSAIKFPPPFATRPGDLLIMPVNEGISYPVDDDSLGPMSYHMYGGHGLCMGWYGVVHEGEGLMTIVHTPDDAVVDVRRCDETLCQIPRWLPQKGELGSARSLRYVLVDQGGYVAMCKRYRKLARDEGRLVTLAEKRDRNPQVDRLIGAVNVWCWDEDAITRCREMRDLGIERILWSRRAAPETLRVLNDMPVLTSRYDIYQDVMNPANFDKIGHQHPDWPTEAWPNDLAVDSRGEWLRGWRVRGRDGQWYPCGVLCDRRAPSYARRRVAAELETHPYRCRFIDTTTAAPWRECYHPDHPMTRSQSRHGKMELLRLMSQEFQLVTGSETGHEAAVPFVHYFEGMLSLGPYRVPDAGRQMLKPVTDPPERVRKFQTGHQYRLPLWELVYHDCVVAQWYWGDYNNKIPELWDRRDLWNALYGTPPMFMFNRAIWSEHKQRFVQSYQTATPVARATGYCEMLSHKWLTDDHSVQQTEFANGVKVTVNFGDRDFEMEGGRILGPLAHFVEGLPAE